MTRWSSKKILPLAQLVCLLAASTYASTQPQQRPPATPLIAHDPYFSVWSFTDKLTDSATQHWTGHPEPLNSMVRIDGKPFRLMGKNPDRVPAMEQTALRLSFTHTHYTFRSAGVQIDLTFFTPAFLNDLDVLSRPVTYLTWTAQSTDGSPHDVSVLFQAESAIATNTRDQPVVFSRHQLETASVLSVGTREQAILNRFGDDVRIDWGYFHVAAPNGSGVMTAITANAEEGFLQNGALTLGDSMESVGIRAPNPRLAVSFALGSIGQTAVSRHVLLSYTEDYAIQFLHTNLRPWWQRNNMSVGEMLNTAEREMPKLEERGVAFDQELEQDLIKSAGEEYAWLCKLAYRQSIAAHKLVADRDGKPLMFVKENFSDGDISTVDVIYPTAPIFLFFNPLLIEAQVLPLLEYAAIPGRWRFPFAPHDLGLYPLANGQDYGGGERTEENQMPVEESGNLLILVDALARTENKADLAERFWPQLSQWAVYLKQHGLDPENQLTTDDFAGHVAHNANLSIKAIDAIAAYADLAGMLHHESEAKSYKATAEEMARKWADMAREGDHYKLAFNSQNTWSQKYNLVWDKILNYNLFPKKIRETEIAFYRKKINRYGLPLDSRADYTKIDWELWTATLADNQADFLAIVGPIYNWTNETPARVPMTDWYNTKNGNKSGFQARSVVGGVFIKALSDKRLADKWRGRVLAP